jgi:hypothetical protein
VGDVPEVPFPVVTEAGFPGGLQCPLCGQAIEPGQPYRDQVESVYDDGDVVVVLTCVYCTPAGEGPP